MPPKNGIAKNSELNGEARLVSSAAFNALLRGLLSRSGFEEDRSHKGTDGMELLKFGAVSKLDKHLGFHIYIDTHTIYIYIHTYIYIHIYLYVKVFVYAYVHVHVYVYNLARSIGMR